MSNISNYPACYMRHENGNCLKYGGFCSSVLENLCEKVHADRLDEAELKETADKHEKRIRELKDEEFERKLEKRESSN